jgi:hypothetical protein
MSMTQAGPSLALAAVAAVLSSTSCTSSGPSRAVERHDCAAVGRFTGAPPDAARFWQRQIGMAHKSGNEILDASMRELLVSLDHRQSGNVTAAIDRVRTICGSFGLWQVYH